MIKYLIGIILSGSSFAGIPPQTIIDCADFKKLDSDTWAHLKNVDMPVLIASNKFHLGVVKKGQVLIDNTDLFDIIDGQCSQFSK